MDTTKKTGLSWGKRIAILYIGFALLILFMVFLSFNRKVDLVSSDYYQQELDYNARIEAINNTNSLKEDLVINSNTTSISIQFPKFFVNKQLTGNIHFFRPSDSSLDKKISVQLDQNGIQQIKSPETKGFYLLKIDLICEGKKYFFEKELYLNS